MKLISAQIATFKNILDSTPVARKARKLYAGTWVAHVVPSCGTSCAKSRSIVLR